MIKHTSADWFATKAWLESEIKRHRDILEVTTDLTVAGLKSQGAIEQLRKFIAEVEPKAQEPEQSNSLPPLYAE